jgi:hypothetical protein
LQVHCCIDLNSILVQRSTPAAIIPQRPSTTPAPPGTPSKAGAAASTVIEASSAPAAAAAAPAPVTAPVPRPSPFAFKLFGLRGAVYAKAKHPFDFSPAALPPESLAAAAAAGADAASEVRDPIEAGAGRWLSPHLTPKLDAWGLGAVLAQLALGAALPTGAAAAATGAGLSPWRSHAGWAALLPELRAMIDALCAEDPAARATIADALSMPFATMELPTSGEEDEQKWEEAVAEEECAQKGPKPQQPATPPASHPGGAARPPASESGASDEGAEQAPQAVAAKMVVAPVSVPADAYVVAAAAASGMTLDAVALRSSSSGGAREEETTLASGGALAWWPAPAGGRAAAGYGAAGGAAAPSPVLARAVLGYTSEEGAKQVSAAADSGQQHQRGPQPHGLWARGLHKAAKRGRGLVCAIRMSLQVPFAGCFGSAGGKHAE